MKRHYQPRDCRTVMAKAPANHVHVALCLNYAGTAFRGLQIQTHAPAHHTLEGALIQALKDADLIEAVQRGRPKGTQHHFARSCRTDRGVHAIRNVVALFIESGRFAAAGGPQGVQDRLNAVLLPEISVARVSVVTGNFIPRHCCTRRVYRYLLPAYAVLPPADGWETLGRYHPGWVAAVNALVAAAAGSERPGSKGLRHLNLLPLAEAGGDGTLLAALNETVDRCNDILSRHFVGSNRFHNFSVDAEYIPGGPRASAEKVLRPDAAEAVRFIYRSEIAPRLYLLPATRGAGVSVTEYRDNCAVAPEPLAPAAEGRLPPPTTPPLATELPTHLPYLMFQIEGNSFLFNMIRKILGAVLAVLRGAKVSLLEEALSPERRVTTPLAPGSNLFLALSTYGDYDSRLGPSKPSPPPDGADCGRAVLRPIAEEWNGPVADSCEVFACDVIFPDIVDVDLNTAPQLDEMLLARDRARRVTRPQWVAEDSHLPEMKDYTPTEEVVQRYRGYAASAKSAPTSEMTKFLRMLRVHNWAIRKVPLREDCRAMQEVKNKRARLELDNAEEAKEGDAAPAKELTADQTPQAAVPAATFSTTATTCDGWVYVADTLEGEAALQSAYAASRVKRNRTWDYGTKDGGPQAATADGSPNDDVIEQEDGDDDSLSLAGSE